ncbi:DUF4148 domain-containing protein [Paraburkholderia lacunae]|uniref:DUF4148 domain-containing protein n=1 Tax=Paraburkholderia lacunae TaxID=2211104 RepID=A0A370N7J2_9BURK|nr:DUF4148 domain-containing protein [Paraburkholderia lacunae]RDK01551.1 hypothetical protein DLM46_17210 [Paraburkholderia lacunae]
MMKVVWVSLCVGLLGATAVGASPARAAGLTRAEVLAELADYKTVGYEFSDAGYPQEAIDASRKVVALRAQRAAAAAARTANVANQPGAGSASN